MTFKQDLINSIFIIIGILLLIMFCSRIPKQTTTTSISYIHDTVYYPVEVAKPVPYLVIAPADSFIQKVPYADSAYCKQLAFDFYSLNIYNQVLVNDSLLTATLLDTIAQNNIQNRKFVYRINRPQTIIVNTTTTAEKQPFGFYIGATVTKLPGNMSVGGSAMLAWRKSAVSYTYDPFNTYHHVTYFYKFFGK